MNIPIDVQIGERVRLFRIAAGFKQKDLAAELGVSYQQIQKYEAGKDKVSIEKLVEISEILNVSIDSFFRDISKMDTRPNRQALTLMKYYSGISRDNVRSLLVDIVKILHNAERKD